MFISNFSQFFSSLTLVTILLFVADHCCVCENSQSIINSSSIDNGFSQAVATWYGSPTGSGSSGGACGFGADVEKSPYFGIISAGNPFLYKSGKGCGSCYQVMCNENPSCSGKPVTVTITDECPGCSDAVHFDLSGKAFGLLAKSGQDGQLRSAGKINIKYQSVPCHYSAGITFKIDQGSNHFYLAFVIEFVSGDGDIASVEISSSNSKGWLFMQQSFGASWKIQLPGGIAGPYSVKVTTIESKKTIFLSNVIPANWAPGQIYHGRGNILLVKY